jgi:4'-phosphopantetheinyl transferase EntD
VLGRVREFTAGRNCARRALEQLGVPAAPILVGAHREPLWPAGIAGSITHTSDYCAAAALRTGSVLSLGVDAEPDVPLAAELLASIADREEQVMLGALSARAYGHWDKLLFCIKEAFFKAFFPLSGQFIDFHAARAVIEGTDAATGSFRIGVKHSKLGYFRDRAFTGAYAFRRGLVLAALALPAAAESPTGR